MCNILVSLELYTIITMPSLVEIDNIRVKIFYSLITNAIKYIYSLAI